MMSRWKVERQTTPGLEPPFGTISGHRLVGVCLWKRFLIDEAMILGVVATHVDPSRVSMATLEATGFENMAVYGDIGVGSTRLARFRCKRRVNWML